MENNSGIKLLNLMLSEKGKTIFGNITVTVEGGELFTIMSNNSSTSTRLLRFIAGFEKIDFGSIVVNGEDINQKKPNDRNLGIVSTEYDLFPGVTVEGNISYPLISRKIKKQEQTEIISNVLNLVGIQDIAGVVVDELSKDKQFLVGLARAIVYKPDAILLDNPLAGFNKTVKLRLQNELLRIHKAIGITMIYTTDNIQEAMYLGDRLAVLNNGIIEQVGSPTEIQAEQETYFVASLFEYKNILKAEIMDVDKKEEMANIRVLIENSVEATINIPREKVRVAVDKVYLAIDLNNIHVVQDTKYDKNYIIGSIKEVKYKGDLAYIRVITQNQKELNMMIGKQDAEKMTLNGENIFELPTDEISVMYETTKGVLVE